MLVYVIDAMAIKIGVVRGEICAIVAALYAVHFVALGHRLSRRTWNRPSLENINAVRAPGLTCAVLPKSLGGDDLPPSDFMRARGEQSAQSGSARHHWLQFDGLAH